MKAQRYLTALSAIGLILLLSLSSVPSGVGAIPTDKATSGNSACRDQIRSEIRALSTSVSVTKALSLAERWIESSTVSSQYVLSYVDMSDDWTFGSSCSVNSLASRSVYFRASNSTGFEGYYVVVESGNLSSVTGTYLQPLRYMNTNPIWSGYEMFGSGTQGSTPIYGVTASWNVPTVSAPSGGCGVTCDISIWPGMTAADEGGSCSGPCLIQAGTDTCINGSHSYCYASNSAWWELLGSPQAVQYCSMAVSTGDSMYVDIYNEYIFGGSINQYELYIYDFTSGHTCSPSSQPFTFSMGTPYYADYVVEAVYKIPSWSTGFPIQGSMYFGSGGLQSIYGPYSNGWYDPEVLKPSGCSQADITVGAISSTGSFSNTYYSSCGT